MLKKKKESAKVPCAIEGAFARNSDEMATNAKRTTETLANPSPLSIESSKLD